MSDIEGLIIDDSASVRDALVRLDDTKGRLLIILDQTGRLKRVITDGDLRRLLLDDGDMRSPLTQLPEKAPISAPEDTDRMTLARMLRENSIKDMPLLDEVGRPVRLVSLQDVQPILLSTPHLGEAEMDYVKDAFESNWIAPIGPNVDGFEADLAAYTGVPHVAAVSSGTAAIHLALMVLDIAAGDRVFCSTMTFAASANPICYQGATPVFIDSAPGTWNMCPKALQRAFEDAMASNQLPKAVIVVSLYGASADMEPLKEICDTYDVPIIEDAAEALGATYRNRAAGTSGLLGVYSFNGNKIITTSGGGALISHDKALIGRAKFLATQAKEPALHYQHLVVGHNYRMSNVLAGIGRGQMRVLDDRVSRRRTVFDMYRAALSDIRQLEFLDAPAYTRATHWLSTLLIREGESATPEQMAHALQKVGVEVRPVWKPLHLQPVFADCPYFTAEEGHSVSDDLFARGLCLPSGTNMSDEDVAYVTDQIRAFFAT